MMASRNERPSVSGTNRKVIEGRGRELQSREFKHIHVLAVRNKSAGRGVEQSVERLGRRDRLRSLHMEIKAQRRDERELQPQHRDDRLGERRARTDRRHEKFPERVPQAASRFVVTIVGTSQSQAVRPPNCRCAGTPPVKTALRQVPAAAYPRLREVGKAGGGVCPLREVFRALRSAAAPPHRCFADLLASYREIGMIAHMTTAVSFFAKPLAKMGKIPIAEGGAKR